MLQVTLGKNGLPFKTVSRDFLLLFIKDGIHEIRMSIVQVVFKYAECKF